MHHNLSCTCLICELDRRNKYLLQQFKNLGISEYAPTSTHSNVAPLRPKCPIISFDEFKRTRKIVVLE
jgi:hypothetical protein